VNGINLIPSRRRATQRRAARVRLWLSIAPAVTLVLAGSYGYLFATWGSGGNTAEAIADANSKVESGRRQLSSARALLAEAQAKKRALREVSEQPDWGLLLNILSGALSDETVLSGCTLDPAAPLAQEPPKEAAPAKVGQRRAAAAKPASASAGPVRPARYHLVLSGFARTQEAVPEFVRRLEQMGVFEQTTLIQSVRAPYGGTDAFQFRIECAIADSAAEGP
jgi:hypothetical protein